MPGRKRKPTELKVLRMSTKRAEKLIAKRVAAPGKLDEAPDWFNAEQKAAWDFAVENAPRDVLKKIDGGVLAGYIVAQDLHRRATVASMQAQLLVKSPKQELPMQNPYLAIVNRQVVLMIRAASELGFTPCSRARLEYKHDAPAHDGWGDIQDAG